MGISVSPCKEAARIGYDERQINRIVIRIAQYFLDRNTRVIFGHDWREDGVMRAVADFACTVAAGARESEETWERFPSRDSKESEEPRMLNIVPTGGDSLSKAALEAQHEAGGVLEVMTAKDAIEQLSKRISKSLRLYHAEQSGDERAAELSALRYCITTMLNPGCRICLGGKTSGYQGSQPGVQEEANLALECGKPLYLLGGFGGVSRLFGKKRKEYWKAENGLAKKQKRKLFETTDIELALRLIAGGIRKTRDRM